MIKEIFRLHPAASLLLPKETLIVWHQYPSLQHPAKTHMSLINLYRFLDSSIDYRWLNFEFLPFGFGWRMSWNDHGDRHCGIRNFEFALLLWLSIDRGENGERHQYGISRSNCCRQESYSWANTTISYLNADETNCH